MRKSSVKSCPCHPAPGATHFLPTPTIHLEHLRRNGMPEAPYDSDRPLALVLLEVGGA